MTVESRTVTFHLHIPDLGVRQVVRQVPLDESAVIEATAILREGGPELNPLGYDLASNDPSIYVQALIDLDASEGSSIPYTFGGSEGEELLFYAEHPTFRDIERLVEAGYIPGRADHIVVHYREGTGGDSAFLDIANWLLTVGVDIGIGVAVDQFAHRVLAPLTRRLRNSRRDRHARKVAALWAHRELKYPWQLREWIDTKTEWTDQEIAKRLAISPKSAAQLLRALGFQKDALDRWHPGTAKKARRRRKRWEDREFVDLFGSNATDGSID